MLNRGGHSLDVKGVQASRNILQSSEAKGVLLALQRHEFMHAVYTSKHRMRHETVHLNRKGHIIERKLIYIAFRIEMCILTSTDDLVEICSRSELDAVCLPFPDVTLAAAIGVYADTAELAISLSQKEIYYRIYFGFG